MTSCCQAAAAAAFAARVGVDARDQRACIELITNNFSDGQLTAALWLHDTHGMALDLPNLRNMLDYWAEVRRVGLVLGGQRARGLAGVALVVTGRPLVAQEFNPMHLIEYFAAGPGM